MIQRVRFEQWIPVPLPRVFRFFSDPENLPRLMPPELAAEIRSIERVAPPGEVERGGARDGRSRLQPFTGRSRPESRWFAGTTA
jgi:uncharacterized protein YndB with AHSA1/START domain